MVQQSPVFKSGSEVEAKYPLTTALQFIKKGKRLTKVEWNNKDIYVFMKKGVATIHIDGEDKNWILSDEDFAGNYIVLPALN